MMAMNVGTDEDILENFGRFAAGCQGGPGDPVKRLLWVRSTGKVIGKISEAWVLFAVGGYIHLVGKICTETASLEVKLKCVNAQT